MKAGIVILIIVGVFYGVFKIWDHWNSVNEERSAAAQAATASAISPSSLPGMPQPLDASLQEAQREGAKGLERWLEMYRPALQDPRLAWIELDYVLLLSKEDPIKAKKLFAEIKKRTPADSPISKRIRDLSKTYE